MSEQLPINPDIVIWARGRAGLSLEEATEKFKKISEWEAGTSGPTYSQLEALSDTLKIPIAVFFFPAPPAVPPINETFRTLPSSELNQLPSKLRLLMRKAKAMQMNLIEICRGSNPSQQLITDNLRFDESVNVEAMADSVRAYLRVSTEVQFSWSDADVAQKAWRDALANVGVFIFKDAFRSDDFSGFCLYDPAFPIIYVNNSCAKTRQIFTYFHELAHLIFRTSGIDKSDDSFISRLTPQAQRIERLCNAFAAAFLVPTTAFNYEMSGRQPSEQTAEVLAAKFSVSREVIFRMMLDRSMIEEADYNAAVKKWNIQARSRQTSGGNPYWTKLAYLGRDYVRLALREYQSNRIDEHQLADYLDVKPRYVHTLESYFERGDA
jgi:Zn-dependent peptidase ImmA (M78 family)